MIFSDSEHAIRSLCYWAPKNAAMGWTCANGDILQDIVKVIKWRVAQTRFIWIKGHAGNDRGDKADALAKEGARKPAIHINYEKLHENPWSHTASGWTDRGEISCEKVLTNLPEVAPPKQGPLEEEMIVQMEAHDGHHG